MQRQQRLSRELCKIKNCPPQGICLYAAGENLDVLSAKITGPDNTPYKDGVFCLEICVSEKYPFNPPTIKFVTKIYHPNIDDNGRICLDVLKMPPSGNWKPTIGIEGLLIAIRMLLGSPNPNDPLMTDIAQEYTKHYKEFEEKAKMFTEKYAH